MEFLIGVARAQEQQPGPGSPGLPQFIQPLFVLGSFFLIFYFLLIRPQQRRQKEMQRMIAAIKRGDRVLTTGGLYGTVWDVKDDLIVLKVADEVKLEVAKGAIQTVVQPKAAGVTK